MVPLVLQEAGGTIRVVALSLVAWVPQGPAGRLAEAAQFVVERLLLQVFRCGCLHGLRFDFRPEDVIIGAAKLSVARA